MKLSRVIELVLFLGILAVAMHVSIDSDTWWHLRAGQWMVENKQIIREDVFSYTSAGNPWQYPGLWVQVMMFGLFDHFGPGGLNLWVSLSVVAIFIFVWQTTAGNILLRAGIVFLAAIASAIYWAARPYLVSYLLFAVIFYLLERNHRDQKGRLWLLPVLMVIWVNSHGGFLAGFVLWAPYFADSFLQWVLVKRQNKAVETSSHKQNWVYLLIVGIAMLGVTGLSPGGYRLWSLPFTTVSRQAEQLFIAEWQSPDFHNPHLMPFAWLLILSIVILGGTNKRLRLYEILLIAGFGVLGLVSVRNIFFFVIIAPAILTRAGQTLLSNLGSDLKINFVLDFNKTPTRMGSILNFFLVITVGIISLLRVVSFLPESTNNEELANQFPVSATAFIKSEKLQGRMFNTYNYGGYLIWALPEYPVFVDGRADLHQDEVILTWYRVINGSDEWKDVFDRWDIHLVLVEPNVPLLAELEEAGWRTIYEDDLAVVAVQSDEFGVKD